MVIVNPFAGYLFLTFIWPGSSSEFYYSRMFEYLFWKLPFHFGILIINIISWRAYRRGLYFGLILEKALSVGRMAMIVCGASIAFAFITIESPVAFVLWLPLLHFSAGSQARVAIYVFICIFLLFAEVQYFKRLGAQNRITVT